MDVPLNGDERWGVPICLGVQDLSSPHLDRDTLSNLTSKSVLAVILFALKCEVWRHPIVIFSLILNFPVTQAKTLVSEQAKVGARSVWGQNGKINLRET